MATKDRISDIEKRLQDGQTFLDATGRTFYASKKISPTHSYPSGSKRVGVAKVSPNSGASQAVWIYTTRPGSQGYQVVTDFDERKLGKIDLVGK